MEEKQARYSSSKPFPIEKKVNTELFSGGISSLLNKGNRFEMYMFEGGS